MYFRLELSFQFCSSWPAGLQQDIASQEQSDVHRKSALKQEQCDVLHFDLHLQETSFRQAFDTGSNLVQTGVRLSQSIFHAPVSTGGTISTFSLFESSIFPEIEILNTITKIHE